MLLLIDGPIDIATAFPRGQIVIGVDASFPPFALDAGGSLSGLDVDIAIAIAQELQLPHRFVNIGYYGLYDALISGQVDLLISELRADPAKMDDVRYTRPYFDNGLLMASAADAPVTDLGALPGMKVAFEFGSAADATLRRLEERQGTVQRFPYELPRYALDALRLGMVDAALVDATSLGLYAREHRDWSVHRLRVDHDFYAIAIRADRGHAWKLVDSALAALKERSQLDAIIAKWL